jgi:hypothetical protein
MVPLKVLTCEISVSKQHIKVLPPSKAHVEWNSRSRIAISFEDKSNYG